MADNKDGLSQVGDGLQKMGGGCVGFGCMVVVLFGILATVWGMLMVHLEGLTK